MRYAQLGNTGLIVSRLAFGAMTFTAGNKDIAPMPEVNPSPCSARRSSCTGIAS